MRQYCQDLNHIMSQDSQSGMSDALAGDVSLDLGLVDSINTDPDKSPSN